MQLQFPQHNPTVNLPKKKSLQQQCVSGAKIGWGATAEVFRLGDRAIKQFKVLIPKNFSTYQAKHEFRIAELLSKAGAVGFMKVHDIEVDDKTGGAWISMEHIAGQAIEKFENDGNAKKNATYVQQVCRALVSALKADVIPGDLSGGNIRIGNGQLTFIDYGFYEILGESEETETLPFYEEYAGAIATFTDSVKEQSGEWKNLLSQIKEEIASTSKSPLLNNEPNEKARDLIMASLKRIGQLCTTFIAK